MPAFPADPRSRASFVEGTLYAIDGGDGWIYFAQVAPHYTVGFFRHRSRSDDDGAIASTRALLCRLGVWRPTVGQALRDGYWRKVGVAPVHPGLSAPSRYVIWPMMSSEAEVWLRGSKGPERTTTIDDPAIQELEVGVAWEASIHVPRRLRVEFGDTSPELWHVGGPVWRHRRIALEAATRRPDDATAARRARDAMWPPDH